ncbi:MAG: DUF1573 domain-containing protein [Alistipes sp.]|nr:DUF1573 domain-containing protein [Alistipes sp.]
MLRVVAIFLALYSFVGCVTPNDKAKAAVPEIDVVQIPDSAVSVNFGRLQQGEVPFYEFQIRNSTDKPIVVLDFESECGCLVAEYPTKPIGVGEAAMCRIEFYSAGQFGKRVYDVSFGLSLQKRYKLQIRAEIE